MFDIVYIFRATVVAQSESFLMLTHDVSHNKAPLDRLPPTCLRALTKALVLGGSTSFEGSSKDQYWNMVCNKKFQFS